jgi:hypothetical protein
MDSNDPHRVHAVVIDGANFIHRGLAWNGGENGIVYNTFRNLRALVERLKPTRLYFVLEGTPKKRLELFPAYKDNRRIVGDPSDPKVAKRIAERASYFRQHATIVDLLSRHFPTCVVRHADFECDDVIHNLILRSSSSTWWTVVSSDSDFTQLLDTFENVSVYNPMKKEYVEKSPRDYVVWKALRGDACDNVPKIVSDREADALMDDPDALVEFFKEEDVRKQFVLNDTLIRFHTWSDEEALEMTSSEPTKDWDVVEREFAAMGFKTILKEGTWKKFKETFDVLWA